MGVFKPLPRRTGLIAYKNAKTGEIWGTEEWAMTCGSDGLRILSAHCEMTLGETSLEARNVVRDTILSVDASWHPHDASVRIMNNGVVTGTGWFRFSDTEAECESWTQAEGRISQRTPISRPMRGFGMHALITDGWMSSTFPFEQGAGHVHHWPDSLIHSLDHLGATGPYIHRSTSGLRFVGQEKITVPAGTFECNRLAFVGMTNNHPPYDMWISTDGDCLYVKGVVEGYMDSVFELTELNGEPLV
jgi:hypothetical protein